jgi:hypothetical protein
LKRLTTLAMRWLHTSNQSLAVSPLFQAQTTQAETIEMSYNLSGCFIIRVRFTALEISPT